MAIGFHHAASRHDISQAQVRHVIRNCAWPLYSPEPDEEDLVIFLGPDEHGVPLEVVAVELEDEGLLVIHAMKLRRKYALVYKKVMEGR